MQQVPLLQTKLYIPPIRPELVSRPRLIEGLNVGLNRKLSLLHEAKKGEIFAGYTSQLLAAFPAAEPEESDPFKQQAPRTEMVEPLSERGIEVLHLIADGLTNQEIASRLFLSLNTVRAHTRNIYGKLDVHSRTQAIARSQEVGLFATQAGLSLPVNLVSAAGRRRLPGRELWGFCPSPLRLTLGITLSGDDTNTASRLY